MTKTEEFIQKAKLVHGDKYDYSKVEYVNSHTKINIICPDHGIFEIRPTNHLCGIGCAKCGGNKKLNTNEFIQKAKEVQINDSIILEPGDRIQVLKEASSGDIKKEVDSVLKRAGASGDTELKEELIKVLENVKQVIDRNRENENDEDWGCASFSGRNIGLVSVKNDFLFAIF